MRPSSKIVISTRNHLFGPLIKNNKIWTKKWVGLVLGKVYGNNPKIKEKCYFTEPVLKRIISTGNHLFGPMIR